MEQVVEDDNEDKAGSSECNIKEELSEDYWPEWDRKMNAEEMAKVFGLIIVDA